MWKVHTRAIFSSLTSENIAIEVTSLFFVLAFNILELTNTNLYLQKICRPNATEEPDLETGCDDDDDEKRGILFVTKINRTYRLGISTVSLFLIIFVSTWSDKSSRTRKRVIIHTIFGQILYLSSLCLQSYFWHLSAYFTLLSEFIASTIFLGNIGFRIFTIMALCDLTTEENRTTRLTMLSMIDTMCMPISSAVSGFMMHHLGFLYTYSMCLSLTLMALVSSFYIRQLPKTSDEKATVTGIFNVKQIVGSFRIVFKNKTGKPRQIICILLLVCVLVYLPLYGELSVLYLYLRRRFKWNEEKYGMFLFYKRFGSTLGIIFCSLVLSKKLKIHDGLIGVFAGFWDTVAVIAYLLASQSWMLYFIPALDVFHGVALTICHSFASKFFKSDEIGQFFSVLLVFSWTVTLGPPIYSTVYEKTMDTYPSAFFLLSMPLNILVCLLYGVCYFLAKSLPTPSTETKCSNLEVESPGENHMK